MIEFTKSYRTADGQVFGTIEQAQSHELSQLFKQCSLTSVGSTLDIAKMVLEKKDLIVDILTTTPNSKPKARASHGGTKARKKTVITDAATSVTPKSNAELNYTGE
jgi:hypothetical protein